MAVTATPVLVQNPKITPITIVNATGTSVVVAATAGANGMKVVGLNATNSDTATANVAVYLTRSATNYLLGTIPVAAGSGTNGSTSAVNLFRTDFMPALPVDNDGQPYLFLESGDTLSVGVLVAVTSGKTVTVTSIAGNF